MWDVMDTDVNFRVTDELLDAVRAKAKSEERTLSSAIRYALRLYVESTNGVEAGEE